MKGKYVFEINKLGCTFTKLYEPSGEGERTIFAINWNKHNIGITIWSLRWGSVNNCFLFGIVLQMNKKELISCGKLIIDLGYDGFVIPLYSIKKKLNWHLKTIPNINPGNCGQTYPESERRNIKNDY